MVHIANLAAAKIRSTPVFKKKKNPYKKCQSIPPSRESNIISLIQLLKNKSKKIGLLFDRQVEINSDMQFEDFKFLKMLRQPKYQSTSCSSVTLQWAIAQ